MAKRGKQRAKIDENDVEEVVEEPRAAMEGDDNDDDDEEEANEDLSLKIVEKALLMREARLEQNENRGVLRSGGDVSKDATGIVSVRCRRGGGGDVSSRLAELASSTVAEAIVAGGTAVKKKKKKKTRKMEIEDKSVIFAEEEEGKHKTIGATEAVEASEELLESEDPNGVVISDNIVLRKLLRGPRYFDPPDSGWSTCYNCGEEGHMAVNCPSFQKKKKPCFVCGSLEHGAKECKKGQDCFICQKLGHQAKDCPEKTRTNTKDSQKCLKCGDSGHDMFSCRNGYPLDDLKEIQCYICKGIGHLCCADFVGGGAREVSCYKCGELGHFGMACSRLHQEANNMASPSSCYKCGEGGHFARECTNSIKRGSRLHEEVNSRASPSSCYKCGESGHFARECTNYVKAGRRNREPSTSKKNKNRAETKYAPHDIGKDHKRKRTKSEEQRITTPRKSKQRHGWAVDYPEGSSKSKSKSEEQCITLPQKARHRGAWIAEHPEESSKTRFRKSPWRSSPTPFYNKHKVSTTTSGYILPNSRSKVVIW